MQISIVQNLDSVASAYASVAENLQRDAVGVALMNIGERIVMTSQILVPVRTGYLKSTIKYDLVSDTRLRIMATANYAIYVELGTRRMAPRLFLTHSIQQHLPDLAAEIENQIINVFNESMNGIFTV